MKTVYFVRHGQSEHNVSSVFQSPDSPLNEKGKMQAEYIANRASKLSFAALIASPFPRAKETAEIISNVTHTEPEFSDLFVECIKPTAINGKSYEDKEASVLWRKWQKSMYVSNMQVSDGESFDTIVARADKALVFLTERPEESLLVVTHGYFLRTLVARVILGEFLSGEAHKKFQSVSSMENTGLTVLRYTDAFEEGPAWRLWIYNDHSHLG